MQPQETEEQGVTRPVPGACRIENSSKQNFNLGGKYCLPDLAISHGSKM